MDVKHPKISRKYARIKHLRDNLQHTRTRETMQIARAQHPPSFSSPIAPIQSRDIAPSVPPIVLPNQLLHSNELGEMSLSLAHYSPMMLVGPDIKNQAQHAAEMTENATTMAAASYEKSGLNVLSRIAHALPVMLDNPARNNTTQDIGVIPDPIAYSPATASISTMLLHAQTAQVIPGMQQQSIPSNAQFVNARDALSRPTMHPVQVRPFPRTLAQSLTRTQTVPMQLPSFALAVPKQKTKVAIAPVPKPSAPVPKPIAPVPKPIAPVPKPIAPVPKPIAPVPKPSAPVPKPNAPVPKPIAPVPKPNAPVPKPIAVPKTAPHPYDINHIHTIHQVYQSTYLHNAHVTGFGDFIRGCYYLLEFCQLFQKTLHIHIVHPIGSFLANTTPIPDNVDLNVMPIEFFTFTNWYGRAQQPQSQSQSQQQRQHLHQMQHSISNSKSAISNSTEVDYHQHIVRPQLGSAYSAQQSFIQHLRKQMHMQPPSGEVYVYTTLWSPTAGPSAEHRQYMRQLLAPNDDIARQVSDAMEQMGVKSGAYMAIHLRCGDANMGETSEQSHHKRYAQFVTEYIWRYVPANTPIILLSDNPFIKHVICAKCAPGQVRYCDHAVGHFGEGCVQQNDVVRNGLLDFYLLGNAANITAFTVLAHGSGFSLWSSVTYNIPYECFFMQ